MWFFEKKVTEEEFSKFQKQVQKSFQKVKADNRDLENQLTVLTKVTMALSPLSKRFTELLKQFSGGSLNRQKKVEPSPPQLKEEKKQPSGFSDIQSGHLTQLEQKGLIFIGRLQNESVFFILDLPMWIFSDKMHRSKQIHLCWFSWVSLVRRPLSSPR